MRALAAAVALLALLAGAGARATTLSLVSQDREVRIDVEVREDHFDCQSCIPLLDPGCQPNSSNSTFHHDSVVAPDASPFVATAVDASFPSTSASQDSAITARRIQATGSHAAQATYSNTGSCPVTYHSEFHETQSRAIVVFTLAADAHYSLTASVTTSGGLGTSSSVVRLSGPGGTVAEVRVDSDPGCTSPECYTVGPEALASSGTLAAGTYTLEAIADGSAQGIHSTSGSFGGAVDGAFEADLVLVSPVPSAGPLGPAALLLALCATGARRSRRSPNA